MIEKKKNPSAFIRNTYNILQRSDLSHIIAWNQEGNGFIIHDLPQFEALILPQYFKHQKYTSFVRQDHHSASLHLFLTFSKISQLNMYGFHKQRHPDTENYFQHQSFRRGQNLSEIKRKPERKKKNEEELSYNQIQIQQIEIKGDTHEQKSQNGLSDEDPNPEYINKLDEGKNSMEHGEQNIKSSINWSFGTLCEQAILQNQILIKIHPILMSYETKLKEYRLKQLKDQPQQISNMNDMMISISQMVKSETMKLSSVFDLPTQ